MKLAMYVAALAGVFLAFGWPFVFGTDPSSSEFHVAAVATLVLLFASIAANLVRRR